MTVRFEPTSTVTHRQRTGQGERLHGRQADRRFARANRTGGGCLFDVRRFGRPEKQALETRSRRLAAIATGSNWTSRLAVSGADSGATHTVSRCQLRLTRRASS